MVSGWRSKSGRGKPARTARCELVVFCLCGEEYDYRGHSQEDNARPWVRHAMKEYVAAYFRWKRRVEEVGSRL